MKSLREQRRFLETIDALDRRLALPPHLLDSRTRRLPPPLDLPAGFHTLCLTCAARPIDQRCDACPRATSRLWRQAAERRPPGLLRRLLRRDT